MSWLRYSDDFTTDRAWDGVSYEARWHYKALVEECSQSRRWDGKVPMTRALRVSDVPDPARCIEELAEAGWLRVTGNEDGNADGYAVGNAAGIAIPSISYHVPPEGMRDDHLLPRKRHNVAAFRARKCSGGEHSKDCPAKTCPVKLAKKETALAEPDGAVVTGRVTGNAGTGLDGTGRTTSTSSKSNSRSKLSTDVGKKDSQHKDVEDWPATAVPGEGSSSSSTEAKPPEFAIFNRMGAGNPAAQNDQATLERV